SAIRLISKAAELDPVSTAILKDKGMIYCYAGRYDKAIEIAKKTLELDPQYPAAHRLMSLCYMGLEKYDEAIKENTKWGGLTGNKPEADFCLAHIYALSGRVKESRDLIEKVLSESPMVDNVYRGLAMVYSALGDIDIGLDMLEKSFELKEIALLSMKVDPKLENLRSEARFQVLLDKMGVAR
ncbi:MAG: tetratricopeptide repeat protein, partial [Acidobacteriota bacterium]|nr:tetratricopeptide repeat protein [Acidobacteriota bacterium]